MAKEAPKRKLVISDEDIEALKKAFAGNEELLVVVRQLLIGNPITTDEANQIAQVFNDESVLNAFRRKVYPTYSDDSKIGEALDYWFGTEGEITGKSRDEIKQVMQSKELARQKFDEAVKLLRNPHKVEKVDLSFDPMDEDKDPLQIKFIARNRYLRSLETGLALIKVIVGRKDESVDDAKRRLELDSAR